MRAGSLRHPVRFVDLPTEPIRNSLGEEIQQDVTRHECRGSIEPLNGREFFAAQQVSSEVTHKLCMRYAAGIRAEWTIHYGQRRFQIVSIRDIGERHRELELMVKELQ